MRLFCTILFFILFSGACAQNPPSVSEGGRTVNKPTHHTTTGFQNDPPIIEEPPSAWLGFMLRRIWFSMFVPQAPADITLSEDEALAGLQAIEGDAITWLGHASFLIRLNDKNILTDPFLSERASPYRWIGPKRSVSPGIHLENLPGVDVIIVSHNHYDHLDDETVRALPDKESIQVLVPLGLGRFFSERGYQKVQELDWGQSQNVDGLKFTALPAVHFSARSRSDRNQTLWASWFIATDEQKLYFLGDSGYADKIFNDIGKQYGPFDYAIVPIGAYEPRDLMQPVHVNPEESAIVGRKLGARHLIASHWGTLALTDEPLDEPPGRFTQAGQKEGYAEQALWIMKIGETRPLLEKAFHE